MISETARTLRPPRNKHIFSTVLIASWAVRVPGSHSLHFMFFPFRYVKASAQYLYKVRLTLQRICQPPCSFTNPSPSVSDSTLRCPTGSCLLLLHRGSALRVCAARPPGKPSLAFLRPLDSGWNPTPTPAIPENVFVTRPFVCGASGSQWTRGRPLFCRRARRSRVLRWADKTQHVRAGL